MGDGRRLGYRTASFSRFPEGSDHRWSVRALVYDTRLAGSVARVL
jgi:hypothetical protein